MIESNSRACRKSLCGNTVEKKVERDFTTECIISYHRSNETLQQSEELNRFGQGYFDAIAVVSCVQINLEMSAMSLDACGVSWISPVSTTSTYGVPPVG